MDVSHTRKARHRGYQGRKSCKNVKQGIRYKVVFSFSMNDRDTKEEIAKKAAHRTYHPLKLGCEKKYSVSGRCELQNFPQQSSHSNNANSR